MTHVPGKDSPEVLRCFVLNCRTIQLHENMTQYHTCIQVSSKMFQVFKMLGRLSEIPNKNTTA